jgi:hypothetical protein
MRHNEEAHISSFLIMQAPRNYLPEAIENSPSGASISLSMEVRDHLLGGLVADLVPFPFLRSDFAVRKNDEWLLGATM